jgi:uncharacterized protein YqfB (UPF0267 family)
MAAILVSIVFFHDLNSAAEAGRLSIFIKDKSLEQYTSFSDVKPKTFDPTPTDIA